MRGGGGINSDDINKLGMKVDDNVDDQGGDVIPTTHNDDKDNMEPIGAAGG